MPPHPDSVAARLQGKRVGVVLSAGYFGFYGHAGFLRALQTSGLRPACWAGTSAGALVAAFAAGGLDADAIADRLAGIGRGDFWDPDPLGAAAGLLRGAGATGLLRGRRFRELLEKTLPVRRFEDCPTPLLLVATNLTRGAAQGFTRGDIAPRLHASCAYPGLFRPVEIDGDLFWDGGLVDKAPVLALADAFHPEAILVHYLPSQRPTGQLAGPFAYARAMTVANTALRRDHFDLQLELVRRSGVPVAVITSELTRLGPGRLDHGRDVIDEAFRLAQSALLEPARELK